MCEINKLIHLENMTVSRSLLFYLYLIFHCCVYIKSVIYCFQYSILVVHLCLIIHQYNGWIGARIVILIPSVRYLKTWPHSVMSAITDHLYVTTFQQHLYMELIRYSRPCVPNQNFPDRGLLLMRMLLNQVLLLVKLKSYFRKYDGRLI